MKTFTTAAAIVLGLCLVAPSAFAGGWVKHKSNKYGMSMLVPKGTKLAAEELGGGWAAMVAKNKPARLLGIAKLGAKSSPKEIEAFGVKLTGVPGRHWKVVDSGKNTNGFKWFKTAVATDGKAMVAAVYGVGPRGSYLLLIHTTVKDYKANKGAYEKWYRNIQVF